MGTILKNILDFTDLVLNVPTSLPHRLNVKGTPVTPKLGGASAEGFTVTADATNVTVTRTINADSGNVRIYVEYWHTFEAVVPLIPPPGGLVGLTPFFFAASGNDVSPIVVEDDGVGLPNPPHAILNFTGTGVTATDAGGGVAQIDIPGNALAFEDEGVSIGPGPFTTANFTGTGVAVTDAGGGVAEINIPGNALNFEDEGVSIGPGPFTTANFIGKGVAVTDAGGGIAQVAIPDTSNNLVFRPGGVQAGNVYTSWTDLMSAKALIQGYKTIQFDSTLGAITIPAGVWDMTDTEWFATGNATAAQQGVFINVSLADGAQFTNLIKIGGTLRVFNNNVGQAAIVLTPATTFVVMDIGMAETGPGFPVISSSAGGAFIDASQLPANAVVAVRLQGQLLGTSAFIDFGNSAARLDMVVFDFALVASGVLRSGPNASLFIIYGGAGTVVRQANWQGPFFPSDMYRLLFGGTGGPVDLPLLRTQILPRPNKQVQTAPSAVPFAGIDLIPNTTWRFDTTAGNIAQTLPAVRANPANGSTSVAGGAMEGTGTILIVKNSVGANAVNLTPNGTDTIDGGAGPLAVPAGGARILQSDGISNWIVVGGYL
jgi:hypothetical protein